MGCRAGRPPRQEGRRDGGCGRGAARGLSAEMLTALSRPMAATLLFPVISGTVLPPTPTTAGPAGAAHGPRGCTCHTHSQTHTHGPPHARTPAQAGAHDGRARPHARAFPHADSHSAAPPSCFTSLRHPRGSPRLKGDACTSPPRLRRSQSRSGPNRAHRLCYDMLQQRSPSFVAPGTGAPVRI